MKFVVIAVIAAVTILMGLDQLPKVNDLSAYDLGVLVDKVGQGMGVFDLGRGKYDGG